MIGRLTADPELRRTGDGTAVCTFTLAVRRPRVKDTSDFVDFVAWRQSAEYLHQYGHKGDIVAVSGPLTSRKWKDKNDNDRINWEIQAETVELLSSKKESQAVGNTTQKQNSYQGGNSYAQQNFQQVSDPDTKLPWEI
jgi:single-strand DNA-binding protein